MIIPQEEARERFATILHLLYDVGYEWKELDDALGVSSGFTSNLRGGRIYLTGYHLEKAIEKLGVNKSFILKGEGMPFSKIVKRPDGESGRFTKSLVMAEN